MKKHILILIHIFCVHVLAVDLIDGAPSLPKRHQHEKVLIVGTGKNIAPYAKETLQQVDRIGQLFSNYSVIFFTDSNDDDTESILQAYVNQSPHTRTLIVNKNNPGIRTERIAFARNALMQEAYTKGLLDSHPIVIQVDMDDILTAHPIDQTLISNSLLKLNQYDVICSNNYGLYYDRWALRTDLSSENCVKKKTCNQDLSHWFGSRLRNANHIDSSMEMLPVQSCFGGFAIYKSSTIKLCMQTGKCLYQGRQNGLFKSKDCEHVYFNQALRQYANAKIAIDPQLKIGKNDSMGIYAKVKPFVLPHYISDMSIPMAADYTFSTQSPRQGLGVKYPALKRHLLNTNNVYGSYHPLSWDGYKIIYVPSYDLPLFFSTWFTRIQSPFILVSGLTDFSLPTELNQIKTEGLYNQIRLKTLILEEILSNPQMIKWYTQNYDASINHPKMGYLPLGLGFLVHENIDLHGEKKSPYSAQDQSMIDIVNTLKPTSKRKMKVYSDTHLVNSSTRHSEKQILPRHQIYATIKNNPLIDFQESPIKRSDQWKKRGEYMFSLSLVGNGFDCHRTWESLILGNIVLLQSSPLDPLFVDLPVIIIKDFSEITQENLEKWALQYGDALTNPNYREQLTTAHWLFKIRNSGLQNQYGHI